MRLYHDADARPNILEGKVIAVIGYGNQGRAQALNLRDSGHQVIVGNRADAYAARAKADRFAVHPISAAVSLADIVLLLIPDEVMPEVFASEVAPRLRHKCVLVFASGYTVAFGLITPPLIVDVILVAPRMVGAGVRERYVEGRGAPAFIGVAQDVSGQARAYTLAVAHGIGATRAGVVEVTFAQEAELDLFTEQCFGPAFGHVLTSSVDLLLTEGYPPEAVLLELYMSGEFAYTLEKIAELGMVEQATLHSTTSQYGSMSRGIRFQLPELREKLREGLREIRSGAFAREWAAEQAEGAPTLTMLREAAREMPLTALESELRKELGAAAASEQPVTVEPTGERTPAQRRRLIARLQHLVSRIARRAGRGAVMDPPSETAEGPTAMARTGASETAHPQAPLSESLRPEPSPALGRATLERVLGAFLDDATADRALQAFAQGRSITTVYRMTDTDLAFSLRFAEGKVEGALGAPEAGAEVALSMTTETLDGMLSGRLNPTRATLAGDIRFDGDARTALTVQRVQKDLIRLYSAARTRTMG